MDASVTIQTQNPAGTSLAYRGGVVPQGYLAEDGSIVSRLTYARLFEAIGTTYGEGDGSTTFQLPDSRGRVDLASGAGSGLSERTLAQIGGEETHTLTEGEMPSHTHVQNPHSHSMSMYQAGNGSGARPTGPGYNNFSGQYWSIEQATASNQYTGGSQAHNNMQPFLVVTKVIKF